MKFKILTWGTSLAVATFIAIASTFAADETTTIRVTLQLPAKHSIGANWLAFKKIVEADSKGELKLQIFAAAQLYKDKETPQAVGSGAVEAGSVFLGRFAGSVPAVEVINVPFLFTNEEALRTNVASGSPMRKALDAAMLQETGAKVLWWQAFGRNIYLNNGNPIRTPKDFKGKKVRTYGKILGWTVEALGGAPTLMSGSKQFLAYQQGAVDVGMTGASSVKTRKLYEVMKNMTLSFDSAIEFVAIMNGEFFNSLSKKHQAIIIKAAKTVEQQLRDHIYTQEVEDVKLLRTKMNVIDLTDTERAEWRTATKGVGDKFAKERGPLAAKIIKMIRN
ncbi:MAG: C4-dicarboxylate ABC transporter [Rhodospirillaceae bacterium TMED8]|nr:C4-dicarboxylate ABC transporter [Magnetovibrio sp.]OUT50523.1 MAG: C4-dicarboxylate ABC transporter [Rhodospirillaceae bacterium TMED8]|tara:strand:+ start:1175 stop:2176 length:1002 start_codon:yes stop_codon:yes gene_type:complete